VHKPRPLSQNRRVGTVGHPTIGWGRIVVTVITLTTLLMGAPAHAALFLVFDTRSFTPQENVVEATGGIGAIGEVVRAHTPGRGAMGDSRRMPVFLVPSGIGGRLPGRVSSPAELRDRPGTSDLGDLVAGPDGRGRLRFRVPRAEPGNYRLVAYCPLCAETSAGRNVAVLAPFRVVSTTLPATGGSAHLLMIVGAGLLMISVGVAGAIIGGASRG
jgi:hypothetical protein